MYKTTLIGIGKAADKSGCNIETIRYYERIRLLEDPGRSSGGHRLYNAAQVQKLAFIKRARELGFSLHEIKALLTLSSEEQRDCVSARAITNQHLDEVRRKIVDLQKLEEVLSNLSEQCESEQFKQCPVLMSLSADITR